MIDRIYIKEIAKELGYKDNRSVKKWCCNHNISIFSDYSSNRQYVLKSEFEIAFDNNGLINNKQKYETDDKSPETLKPIQKIYFEKPKNKSKYNYKPQGVSEKKFLESSIFTNL